MAQRQEATQLTLAGAYIRSAGRREPLYIGLEDSGGERELLNKQSAKFCKIMHPGRKG